MGIYRGGEETERGMGIGNGTEFLVTVERDGFCLLSLNKLEGVW